METEVNTLQRSYKIHHFTLTVSPHYLGKLRTTKNELKMSAKINAQLVNDHVFE